MLEIPEKNFKFSSQTIHEIISQKPQNKQTNKQPPQKPKNKQKNFQTFKLKT